MAHRGVDTLRFGPMKPVGLVDPRTGRAAVRGRAAAAGQPGRRSLQPGRLPDAAQVGRAGARAAADSRARAGRVRALRHGAPQHVRQRADGAARDVAGARAPDAVLRRADVGRRGLRRVGGVGAARRAQRRRARARASRRRRRRGRRRSARWRYYVSHADPAHYEPSNITFGIMEPLARAPRGKMARKLAHVRARAGAISTAGWRRDGASTAPAGLAMTEHLKAFLQFLALNRNAVAAHGARVRERPRRSSSTHVGRARRASSARDLAAGGARPRRRSAASSPTLHAQGQSRATAARKLAAVRTFLRYLRREGAHRRRSRRAGRRRRSAKCACRRTCPKTR